MKDNLFSSWKEFAERLLDRFSRSMDEDPAARLFSLHHTGDIADYVNAFEELKLQVTGIDEKNLIKVFYNGLKPEMKEVISMKEPQGLTNHITAVMKMQTTVFCKVMSADKQTSSRQPGSSYTSAAFGKRTITVLHKAGSLKQ